MIWFHIVTTIGEYNFLSHHLGIAANEENPISDIAATGKGDRVKTKSAILQ